MSHLYGNADPIIVYGFWVSVGFMLLALAATIVAYHQGIVAIFNVTVARPIYLARLHARGVQEWKNLAHSYAYTEALRYARYWSERDLKGVTI